MDHSDDVKCVLVSLGEQSACSGLLLSDGWVLSHGSLLSSESFESLLNESKLEKDLVELHLEFRVQYHCTDKDSQIVERKSSQSFAYRCPRLRQTFNELLFSWSFGKVSNYNKSLLPIFILIKLDDCPRSCNVDTAKTYLRRLYGKVQEATGRGATLELESAPFARADFLGSVSRGLLSNVLGDCLLMSDVHAVPGCEGSPIFLIKDGKKHLVGMVVASLSWCRGELVGYTFAASLRPCLEFLLRADGFKSSPSTAVMPYRDQSLDRSLVVVKCGAGWGTGVVLDNKTVLTCSHVVRESPSRIVQIGAKEAELVYRTPDDRPYDVAVLRLVRGTSNEEWKPLELASQPPAKGSTVLAAGFPFFSDGAPASCSRGVISRVTHCVIQTSCCVQSGASGGPVIDVFTGRMLGLVVSNAKSAEPSSILYPRFNMAVPSTVLRRPIVDFMQTGDVKCLDTLSSDDPTVHETWNYNLTPRSKM